MRTTDNSSTPPSYTPPKHSLGESLPKPKARTIDELLALDLDFEHGTFPEDKRVYEALREARALLAHVEIQGGHAAGSAGALLAKWRGEG